MAGTPGSPVLRPSAGVVPRRLGKIRTRVVPVAGTTGPGRPLAPPGTVVELGPAASWAKLTVRAYLDSSGAVKPFTCRRSIACTMSQGASRKWHSSPV